MLFIMILFHAASYRDFKHFYLYGICHDYRDFFSEIPHYARFVALMPRLLLPLSVLLYTLRGEETGLYFADSTALAVCHNRRIARNKVFDGLASRGKTSMGWFYGLKLHTVINHKGQIMAIKITPGHVNDRNPLEAMMKGLTGKVCADKGYIGKDLFNRLWNQG